MERHTDVLTAAGLNLIAQGLSVFDDDLKLVICNAPFQTMFALPDDLVRPGATFEDTIKHLAERGEYGEVDDIEAFVKERVDIARAFEPHYTERTRANGRTISVEGAPLPQGGWVAVYTDITPVKQQEALLRARASELSEQVFTHTEALAATNRELAATISALEEAKRQLTESEARMRMTTEMMPAHIAHADVSGRYTYSNRRLSTVLPGSASRIVGQDFETVLGTDVHNKIRPSLNKAYRGDASVLEFTDEKSARRIRTSFTPDGTGGVYIMSMDVTQETQARAALQQTRKRELAAQVTSGLAHDFSNLLTIILGLQSQLKALPDLPEQAATLADGIQAAAHRGGRLLGSIADMTVRRGPRPTSVNVEGMLADLATLAETTLPPEVHLTVACDLPNDCYLFDGGQMQDALLNLLLNARDACGNHGQIEIKAREAGENWLEFAVTDTGPGFSDSALERAFDPFFTTKGGEGSGLGLAMVYDMTKLAGGDLRLSNGESGALVRLRLPLRRAPKTQGGMVLLVEDSEELRAQYRDILLSMGQTVIEATTVEEAIALMADLPEISLVLSDIRLEGSATGVDLARHINGRTPVVLMTSLTTNDPLFRAGSELAPILQKPFAPEALAQLISPEAAA